MCVSGPTHGENHKNQVHDDLKPLLPKRQIDIQQVERGQTREVMISGVKKTKLALDNFGQNCPKLEYNNNKT